MAGGLFTDDAEKYLKPDVEGGFLTDKTEIENEVVNNKLEVIDNLMLGNFDSNGNYAVSEKIIEELIKTPKRLENSFNGTYFFVSLKFFGRFGQLKFSCKFVEEKDGYFAKLYLLEPMVKANGFYINTNSLLLESIKGKQDKDFIKNVFACFHVRLIEDPGDSKTEFEEEEYPAIFNRKWLLLHLQVKKEMALTQAQKKLFEKKLELLDKTLTKDQMVIIKTEIKKISKIFVKEDKSKYKNLNQVLDKVLTGGEIKVPSEVKQKVEQVQNGYSVFVQSIKSLNVEKTQPSKTQPSKTQSLNVESKSQKTNNVKEGVSDVNVVVEKLEVASVDAYTSFKKDSVSVDAYTIVNEENRNLYNDYSSSSSTISPDEISKAKEVDIVKQTR